MSSWSCSWEWKIAEITIIILHSAFYFFIQMVVMSWSKTKLTKYVACCYFRVHVKWKYRYLTSMTTALSLWMPRTRGRWLSTPNRAPPSLWWDNCFTLKFWLWVCHRVSTGISMSDCMSQADSLSVSFQLFLPRVAGE